MFYKRVFCAFVLMSTLVRDTEKKGMTISNIAEFNNIPVKEFDESMKRLIKSNMIMKKSPGTLFLNVSPDKVTLWDILTEIESDELFLGDFFDDDSSNRLHPSTMTTMLRKESESLSSIIKYRLGKVNLKKLYEKTSKTIYV